MKKIKILRIIDRLNIGGPAIHCIILTAHLNNDQFISQLITGTVGTSEGDMSYLADENNVSPIVVPELGRKISLLLDLVTLWKLVRLIYKEKPDIIHTHKSKAGVLGRLAGIFLQVPILVHTFHGHVFHHYFGKWKTKFFLFIERLFAKFTDCIIVISEQQKKEILGKYQVGVAQKFAVIPLGFDFSRFDAIASCKGYLRRKFSITEQEIVVGLVGRLTPVKNQEMLLQIAQKMLPDFPQFRFVMIGDGECRQKLESQAQKLGVSQRVIFTGWIQNPAQIYADIDIVVLTSNNEGTPVTLIEAMYCSKPIVATQVGGICDIIQHNKNGYLVPPNDIETFKHCLIALSNHHQREKFGKFGKYLSQQFIYSRLVQDIQHLYISLLEKKYGTTN